MSRLKYDRTKRTINTLTGTRVFKEISVRTRVHQYQAFSARCSHRYFSNASRSCGGLKNDLSFLLFATLKPLLLNITKKSVVQIIPTKWFLCHHNQKRNQMVQKTWHSTASGNFCCKRFDGLQNCNKEEYKYQNIQTIISCKIIRAV